MFVRLFESFSNGGLFGHATERKNATMLSASNRRFLQRALDGRYGPGAAAITAQAVRLFESSTGRSMGVRPSRRLHETAATGPRVDVGRMTPAQLARFIRGGSPSQQAMMAVGAPVE